MGCAWLPQKLGFMGPCLTPSTAGDPPRIAASVFAIGYLRRNVQQKEGKARLLVGSGAFRSIMRSRGGIQWQKQSIVQGLVD